MAGLQWQGWIVSCGHLVVGLLLTAVIFAAAPWPWALSAAVWMVIGISEAVRATRSWVQAWYWNLAVVVGTLGVAELYAHQVYFAEEPPRELIYRLTSTSDAAGVAIDQFAPHPILGYAPYKGQTFTETARYNGSLMYDVTYQINAQGLRVSTSDAAGSVPGTPCILFFGDSFTFGEGVHDEETLPSRTASRSGGAYQVQNFGFVGYGPHQMLAQIQHGLVQKAVTCTPRYAIYQAIPSHVSRAAGLESWDQAGPWFVLDQDGHAVQQGQFTAMPQCGIGPVMRRLHASLPIQAKRLAERSSLYRALLYLRRATTDEDVARVGGIVAAANTALKTTYPGIEVHVILWDFSRQTDPTERALITALQSAGLRVHLVSTMLPEYVTHREEYILHPADGHPNARAYNRLATYLIDHVIAPPSVTATGL